MKYLLTFIISTNLVFGNVVNCNFSMPDIKLEPSFAALLDNIVRGCEAPSLESVRESNFIDQCLDGLWAAFWTDNVDMIESIGSALVTTSKSLYNRNMTNRSEIWSTISDSDSSFGDKCLACTKACMSLILPGSLSLIPTDSEVKTMSKQAVKIKNLITVLVQKLKYGTAQEIKEYLVKLIPPAVYEQVKGAFDGIVSVATDPKMAPVRNELICNIVGSIGVEALFDLVTVGAGAALIAARLGKLTLKLNKISAVSTVIANLQKLGELSGLKKYISKIDNIPEDKVTRGLMSCAI